MSEQSASDQCFIRGCVNPASGFGGRIPQPLCVRHLAQDSEKVRELRISMKARLEPMLAERDKIRIRQQTLAVELQAVEDLFDEALDSWVKWRSAVTTLLTERHDNALQNLGEFSMLQEYENAITAAESDENTRKVFELTSEMELKCTDLEEKLEANEKVNCDTRVVGDVSGGLRDLRLLNEVKMKEISRLCESTETPSQTEKKELCQLHSEILELEGAPQWIAVCSNTNGYVGNSEGNLVKASTVVSKPISLTSQCLFVVFHVNSGMDHILATSIDGTLRLAVNCAIDWSVEAVGLQCDSDRQSLYIAQSSVVTVADLSGSITHAVNAQSLGLSECKFVGMTGNSDKLFLLEQKNSSIFCLAKDGEQLQSVIDVSKYYPTNSGVLYEGLSAFGHFILMTDWASDQLHKICTVSHQLVVSYPTDLSEPADFEFPADVAVHSSGLIFVSRSLSDSVYVLLNDGTILQTLQFASEDDENESEGDDSSNSSKDHEEGSGSTDSGYKFNPYGLAVVEGDPPMLAVCQEKRKAVSIFTICCV